MTWWHGEPEAAVSWPAVPKPRAPQTHPEGDAGEAALLSAAQGGDQEAAHRLGRLYAQRGDRSAARHWWERAASAGNIDSAYNLGVWHEKHGSLDEAVDVVRAGRGSGDVEAAVNLAALLLEQRGDVKSARRWFESGRRAPVPRPAARGSRCSARTSATPRPPATGTTARPAGEPASAHDLAS